MRKKIKEKLLWFLCIFFVSKPGVSSEHNLPVKVDAHLDTTTVEANRSSLYTISLTPEIDCTEIQVHIYGIDGIQVVGVNHAILKCETNKILNLNSQVLIPSGVSGSVAVTVGFISKEGERTAKVFTFPLESQNDFGTLQAKSRRQKRNQVDLIQTANGPIIRQKASSLDTKK